MAAIAEDAGVAVDTVSRLRRPETAGVPATLESALSGTDEEVPGPGRDYVKQIEATSDAVVKLAVYAEAVTSIQGETGTTVRGGPAGRSHRTGARRAVDQHRGAPADEHATVRCEPAEDRATAPRTVDREGGGHRLVDELPDYYLLLVRNGLEATGLSDMAAGGLAAPATDRVNPAPSGIGPGRTSPAYTPCPSRRGSRRTPGWPQ